MAFGAISLILVVAVAGCAPAASTEESALPVAPAAVEKVQTVRVGTIAVESLEEMRKLQPFLDHLELRLGDHGYDFAPVVAPSVSSMVELFRSDGIDVYLDSPFPVYQVARSIDLDVILRRWKHGVEEYHSVIFVRADSDIEEIAQFRSHLLAFEAPFSTASYALPKADLLKAGVELVRIEGPQDPLVPGKVSYLFTDDDETTLVWVLAGKADAGAMNDATFERLAGAQRDELRIIHRTMTVPRQLVACRPGLPAGLVQELKATLLAASETAAGKRALAAFESTARFDLVNNETELRRDIGEMIALLESR